MGPHLLRAKAFLFASSLFLFLPFLLFLNRSSGRGARELGSYGGLRLRGLGLGSGGLLGGWRWRGPHEPAHVRVVIRTHEKELLLLRSLIYGLRAQREAAAKWLGLDFVLVPTEPGAQETYRRLSEELNVGFNDTRLLDVPDAFYDEAKAENPYVCTAKERADFLADYGPVDTRALCDQDHYMYFKATDRALAEFAAPCGTCTHVLITNGDNAYAPDFFTEATDPQEDIVVVGFTHAREPYRPTLELGAIDMGAVLIRKRVLDGGRKLFLTSLPKGARARAVHGADFWFVKHAVDRGNSIRILKDRILMYHH